MGNVVIDNKGYFRTTMPVKLDTILFNPDWPLGIAARDIEADEILEYSSHKNTKDVILECYDKDVILDVMLKLGVNANTP